MDQVGHFFPIQCIFIGFKGVTCFNLFSHIRKCIRKPQNSEMITLVIKHVISL